MDNEKYMKQPPGKKEKNGWDFYRSVAVFIVLPVILSVLIPLGGLAYLCGRWSWPLGLVACMLYPAIALFIVSCFVAGIDRLADGWTGHSRKKKLLIAAEIGVPAIFVVLLAVTFLANIKLGLCFPGKVFVHGFRDRIQNKGDIPAIRDWLRTLDKSDCGEHNEVVSRIFRTFCSSDHSGLWYRVICPCPGPLKGAARYRNITPPPSPPQLALV